MAGAQKMLNILNIDRDALIDLWRLDTAFDGSRLYGSYRGLEALVTGTLSKIDFGLTAGDWDGLPSARFYTGVSNAHINFWSQDFENLFNANEGSVIIHLKALDVNVWDSDTADTFFEINSIATGSGNFIEMRKGGGSATRRQIGFLYRGNWIVTPTIIVTNVFYDDWFTVGMTWSFTNGRADGYRVSGGQFVQSAPMTSIGQFTGSLNRNSCLIGQRSSSPGTSLLYFAQYFAIWNRALTATEMQRAMNV